MRRIFFLSIIFIIISSASGRDTIKPLITFKHLGEEEGLTAKTVYSILQDKKGCMWFATDAGAFSYDGKKFRQYTVDDGISDNEILNIYEDKSGKIWFMTLNGFLSYWYNGKIYNSDNTPLLKEAYLGASIACCYEDTKGRLWFGCIKSGFIMLDKMKVRKFYSPYKDRPITLQYVYEDSEGEIWYFRESNMINMFSNDSIPLLNYAGVYMGCYSKKNYEIFYCSNNGIFKVINKKLEPVIESSIAPSFLKVINLKSEKENLWVCTLGDGCYYFKNGQLKQRYLPNSSVTSLLKDREGNIWFSTMNEGVYVLYNNENYVSNYDALSGLNESKSISITKDENGALWIGYINGKVDRINNNIKTTFKLTKSYEPDFCRITSMLALRDTIWCGTDFRMYYITHDKVTAVPYLRSWPSDITYAVKQVSKDHNDKLYATVGLNFLQILKDEKGFFCAPLLDSITRTFSAIEMDSNNFIVSGMNGVMELSPGNFCKKLKTDIDLSHERILDMKLDEDGQIIFATNSNGIFVIENGKLQQHLSVKNGLSNNNCRRLFIIDNLLYVSTANGLNILIKKNRKWQISDLLTIKNGLLSNSINEVYVDSNSVYIATDKGLSIVHRNLTKIPIFITNVLINEVVTEKAIYNTTNNFSFTRDIPRLLIKFSYPVYNPVNRTKIKYRLIKENETDQAWILTNNNEVEFSTLPPGSYTFQVKPDVSTAGIIPITNLYLTIKPLWWQTTIMRFLLILLILAISAYIIRRRVKFQFERRLYEQKQLTLLESERNRIASDMHDDIGADLTKISIWSNILKSKITDEKSIVDKVARLANDVLQKMDQIIWALNSIHNQTGHLLSYLHAYSSEYLESADIILNFETSEEIPNINIGTFQRRCIFLVIKELLHNTVKHSKAKNVHIKISIKNKNLIIDYSNDGKGFNENEKGDGLGLTTMKNRMSEINSTIEFINSPDCGFHAQLIIDLYYKTKF